jgi:hypothetical protein
MLSAEANTALPAYESIVADLGRLLRRVQASLSTSESTFASMGVAEAEAGDGTVLLDDVTPRREIVRSALEGSCAGIEQAIRCFGTESFKPLHADNRHGRRSVQLRVVNSNKP